MKLNAKVYEQMSRFLIVGIMTVILDFIVYMFFYKYLAFDIHISKGLGFMFGTLFAFHINKSWTFKVDKSNYLVFLKFISLYATTLFINMKVNYIFQDIGNVQTAFIAATATSAIVNFCGMKWLVFTNKI